MAQPLRKWLLGIVTVVGVIAFVVGILSFLSSASEERREHQQSCQSNLKQLGLALIEYEQDSDNTLPSGVNAAGNGWAGQLYPYIKSKGIYQCPEDPHEGGYISYAANRNLVGKSYSKLGYPNDTIALYEFATLNCDPAVVETSSTTGISAPHDSTRHDSSTFALNFLMADGRVKKMTPGQVSGGANAVSVKALPQGEAIRTFAVR